MRKATAERAFFCVLGLLLLGYAFGGKSFAQTQVGPIYISEIVLAFGIVTALFVLVLGRFRKLHPPLAWMLLATMMVWGAIRTIPYIDQYGFDALRDAALWGYGLFAFFVAGMLPDEWLRRAVRAYAKVFVPAFLLWMLFVRFLWPGLNLLSSPVKAGDIGVHLGGIAALLIVQPRYLGRGAMRVFSWAIWGFLALRVASENRGGAIASVSAVVVAALLLKGKKLALIASLGGLLLIALVVLVPGSNSNNQQVLTRAKSRIVSITDPSVDPTLAGTRNWRLDWWGEILHYTVGGQHFWGKGYGINLADDDGFQVIRVGAPLRSPHNVSMTYLSRSGVPGFLLWLVFLSSTAMILRKAIGAAAGSRRLALIWVTSYLSAFLVNATFDVFLEGPQGGIWFWSLVGLAMALAAPAYNRQPSRQAGPAF